ncbi:MAG: CBS domain-containing protein [Caldilineae bacterium]|nr:MAG: CBS domain-containing protein [Caldilineae bacterium]
MGERLPIRLAELPIPPIPVHQRYIMDTPGSVTITPNLVVRLSRFNRRLLDRYQPSETTILLLTALIVGLSTGLGAVGFIWLIGQADWLFFDVVEKWLSRGMGRFAILLIPALGGLVAGPLIDRFAKEAKGHGVPEVMQAIALRGGRIRPAVVVVKAVASAACIGSGGSAGREGPIVQIGSAIGSVLGQLFNLSDSRIRNLVACGAASGIAAVFNAPIAGAIFAMEVILGEFSTRYFGTIVISAVAASIVSRHFLGDSPAFVVPAYSMVSSWEILLYTLLGLLTALGAWLFVTTLYWFEDRFDEWQFPNALKPVVGGVLLGVLALYLPDTLGSGLEFIGESLVGKILPGTMALLIFGKMLATNFTLGSGNSGGVFAPSLYMGAMLGGAFGVAVHTLLPDVTASAGAYALVGMAALFAAATHAPITAVIIVFEMSGDYRLILPLMFATVVSTLLSERLRRENIYTLKLARRGIQIRSGRDVDVMQGITVGEVMQASPATISWNATLNETMVEFSRANRRGLPVVDDEGRLFGFVTVEDVERAMARNLSTRTPVKEIAIKRVLVAYPDETMADVMRRMNVRDIERLPVVSRDDPKQLLGIIRQQDLLRAYNLALTNRAKVQYRMERLKLRNVDNAEFVEVEITPDAPCAGKTIADLAGQLPYEAVVVSVHRPSGQVLVAHGDTCLEPGDRVVVYTNTDSKPALLTCLLGEAASRGEAP